MSKLGTIFNNLLSSKFLKLYLPVATIIVLASVALFLSEKNSTLTKIQLSEINAVKAGSNSVKRIMHTITSDLFFLAQQKALSESVSNNNKHHSHEHIKNDWRGFSKTKAIYDQIRWLDNSGQEKIRVNYNQGEPIVVPEHQLQNKVGRYYFLHTIKLNKDEFFISPLDLNIEKGAIEQPLKPVIRFGTPTFDYNFQKKGVLLLNYFGEHLLADYKNFMGKAGSRAWLLNSDGYWMKGPSSELEWGFMYKRQESSMAKVYPEVWKIIGSSIEGQFADKHGLWTFTTVYPLIEGQKISTGNSNFFSPSLSDIEMHNYYWKSILFLPAEDYDKSVEHIAIVLATICLVLLIGFFYGSWRLANAWMAEEKAEQSLKRINENLEHIVDERTRELRQENQERHKTELALKEREKRFRSITDTSSVAMIITIDESGNVITWNPAAERIFGYQESEILGQSIMIIIPDRYREAHKSGLEHAVKNETYKIIGKTVEVYGINKKGEEFPIELSLGTWKQSEVRYFSAVIHDISARKRAEDELKYLANHDVLTGLPTRRLCLDRINCAILSAERNKNRFAVLFIDLDGFKAVNDTLGHDAGDNLLIGVSERLKNCLRKEDTIARIGGDEFVIVLVAIEKSGIENVANKIIKAISEPFPLANKNITIGTSIGIAVFPDNAKEPEELLQLADSAMYSVKNKGKNNYTFIQGLLPRN